MNYARAARKIVCIGRNYAAHIAELRNCAPAEPFFFLKPSSAVLEPGRGPLLVPRGTAVHHEVELALVLSRDLTDLPPSFDHARAMDCIAGYALALDITARDVQAAAKRRGLPWSIAKGFDTFLPLSPFIEKHCIPDPYNVDLQLSVNGTVRQSDKTNLMLFPIHDILRHVSAIMTLQQGDLILTGTPQGVGPIVPGDSINASLSVDGRVLLEIVVDAAEKPGPYCFTG